MAYDEKLAARLRDHLAGTRALSEQKMFGGLAFLVGGHMAVAASGRGGLLVRVAPEDTERLVDEPAVAPMIMRGRPMDGWLRVDASVVTTAKRLALWADRGVAYAQSFRPK